MKKIINQRQSEVHERVVTRNGQLFLVRFVIVDRDGKLRGRVLSCEAIKTLPCTTTEHAIFCLPEVNFSEPSPISRKFFREIISPYFSLDFLTVVQIRAPAEYKFEARNPKP